MKRKYASIKQKLLRIVLITSGVVLFLTCSAFFAYEFFTYRQAAKYQLSTIGKIIAANSTAALAFESQGDANEILHALKAQPHIIAACLYDDRQEVFARYPLTISGTMIPAHPGAEGYHYKAGYLEGFEPVIQQGKRIGTLYLRSDMDAIYNTFKLYGLLTSVTILIVICVAYLLSRRLQKTISDPILALAETAGIVSTRQDYTVRARKHDNDELGELTDAFNHMLTQIEQQNAEIISFNHALEKKVEERTNDLELANLELKLKNDFVETIIDSSIAVIAVFDKDLRYVMLNKYARKIYGIQPENVIGKHIMEVFPMLKDSKMYKDLNNCLHGGMIHDPYYRSALSDMILENFYIPLFDKDGNIYSVLVIGHDITQIVNATEKLNTLNNELVKSNLDLEQFAYVASHDLQEPLRKIQTYSTLLEKKIDDREAAAMYISKIISSAVRMSDLIKSILNYSKASNINGRLEKVDLNEVIEHIKVDFEVTIHEKQAEIKAGALPVVKGDKLQLTQLFFNLVSNSLKFSQKKPEIIIHAAVVQGNDPDKAAALEAGAAYLQVTYTDNGIGFDQQYADKVFTIFQRLHNRNEYPGTGIGLALCKKIMDNHKGHISVTSKPGQGTTFRLYFPLYQLPYASQVSSLEQQE